MIVKDIFHGSTLPPGAAGPLYGLEVEVEGIPLDETAILGQTDWTIVSDGSLRNGGFEYVSRPLTRRDATSAIRWLYDKLSRYPIRPTIRTSTHVHTNMLMRTFRDVQTVLTFFSLIEPLLFKLCGVDREENIYCIPWYRSPDQPRHIKRMLDFEENAKQKDKTRPNLSAHYLVANACKYSSVYLEPLRRFGTLEFRMAPLFRTEQKMQEWVSIIEAVVYGTMRKFYRADEVLRYEKKHGVEALFTRVMGPGLYGVLQRACMPMSVDAVVDAAGSLDVAQACVPSLYTYKAKDSWQTIEMSEAEPRALNYSGASASPPTPMHTWQQFREAGTVSWASEQPIEAEDMGLSVEEIDELEAEGGF